MASEPLLPVVRGASHTDYRSGSTHYTVYSFELAFAGFSWVIHKRFNEVDDLFDDVKTFHRTSAVIFTMQRPTSKFFGRFEPQFVAQRERELLQFLRAIASSPLCWRCDKVRQFFEVSAVSFRRVLGRKGKEGWIRKKSGGRKVVSDGKLVPWDTWYRRWFVLKDSFLAYFKNPNDTVPQDVFTLDDDFSMFLAPRGVKLRIANRSREMLLEFDSNRELQDWVQTIRVFLPASSAGSVGGFRRRPFGSFAPQRLGCTACWLVEGATVFAAMTKAMLAAKTTIFIAGWWTSPDVRLLRPVDGRSQVTLRDVLLHKAMQGVHVYVILYREVEAVLSDLASKKAKDDFTRIHANIHVLRHPNHISINPFESALYWSHHDKVVVVDQKLAFVGGIDLAPGRYDTSAHLLDDVDAAVWPDGDYYNPGVKGALATRAEKANPSIVDHVTEFGGLVWNHGVRLMDSLTSLSARRSDPGVPPTPAATPASSVPVSALASPTGASGTVPPDRLSSVSPPPLATFHRSHHPRMPWHDVSVAVGAPAACDIALHFIQRWNHHRLVKREKHQTVLMPNSTLPVSNSATPWWQHDAFPDPEDIGKLDVPATLPGLAQPFLVAQTSQHYSTRDLTREAATSPSIGATLVPAVSEEYVTALANEICPSAFQLAFRDLTGDSCTGVDRTPADLDAGAHFGVSVQVVRSVSEWSLGMSSEPSVGEAYCTLIDAAQHFIYIENQFFISSNAGSGITNTVVDHLVNKIVAMAAARRRFRVIVVLPVHPEGDPDNDKNIQAIMHFQFTTICRGTSPLFTLLKSKGVNPWEYISFYSLRTEGRVGAARHSEQVYVHSKVMIVDDLVALIGSANINDRSLGKDTDSEIAVVVSGGASVLSRMDGMQYLASEFVHCLRVRLWREHLGLLRTPGYDVSDAVSDEVFFGLWMTIARSNTAYYQKHFPETARFSKLFDSVTLDAFPIPERPMGHVVWFSYEFLCDKDNGNMLPWYLSKLPFPLSIFH